MTKQKTAHFMRQARTAHFRKDTIARTTFRKHINGLAAVLAGALCVASTTAHAWDVPAGSFNFGFAFLGAQGGGCEFDGSFGDGDAIIQWEDGGSPTFAELEFRYGGGPDDLPIPGVNARITADTLSTGCLGGLLVENFSVNLDTSLTFAQQTEMSFSFCAVLPDDGFSEFSLGVAPFTSISGDGTAMVITYGYRGPADGAPVVFVESTSVTSCAAVAASSGDASTESVIEDNLLLTTIQTSRNASDISRRAAARLRRNRAHNCEAEIAELLNAQDIRFASDSFVIDARNDGILDSIANALGNCDDADFLIAGHTDWNASDAYNITLSQNRVDAVKGALVRRGVARDRLTTRGFGESQPIATNETEQGRAANRRVEFIQINVDVALKPSGADHCVDGANSSNSLNGSATNGSGFLNGVIGSSVQNCATGTYTETWLDIDVSRADVFGTQARVSLGFSKEIQAEGRLRGYFVEGYAQRTSIDVAVADGSITGFGVHAGLFGAHAVQTLTASYYASGALGHQQLDFDTAGFGDADYTYIGVFFGGALTGERAYTSFVLRPSLGLDLGYGDSISADIAGVSDVEIDAARYARISVSVGFVRPIGNDVAPGTLALTPRFFCETSSGTFGEGCGIGGSVDYDFASADNDHLWSVGADYDRMDDASRASLNISRSRSFANGNGSSVSRLGVSNSGIPEIGHDLTLNW